MSTRSRNCIRQTYLAILITYLELRRHSRPIEIKYIGMTNVAHNLQLIFHKILSMHGASHCTYDTLVNDEPRSILCIGVTAGVEDIKKCFKLHTKQVVRSLCKSDR